MSGKGRLNTVHPVQGDLLPERDVPQFLINRVGSKLQSLMRKIVRNPLKDVGRGRGCAVANKGLLQFVQCWLPLHGCIFLCLSSMATNSVIFRARVSAFFTVCMRNRIA